MGREWTEDEIKYLNGIWYRNRPIKMQRDSWTDQLLL